MCLYRVEIIYIYTGHITIKWHFGIPLTLKPVWNKSLLLKSLKTNVYAFIQNSLIWADRHNGIMIYEGTPEGLQ